jgi:membrane associated rhomboid family serine protease
MLPIKTDVRKKGIPVVSLICIAVCVVVYCFRFPRIFPGGLVPLDFVYSLLHPRDGLGYSVIVLLSSFFLHGSIIHLLGNMWYLWVFGCALELTIGPFRFLCIYFFSGIAAMVTQVVNNPLSTIPVIGASGAIAGVMGTYLILLPFSKIILGFPPIITLRLHAAFFLLFWLGLQWSSVVSSHPSTNGIAWWAHIGGFCFGMLAGIYLRCSSTISKKNKHGKMNRQRNVRTRV